jgi:hypothetical protein
LGPPPLPPESNLPYLRAIRVDDLEFTQELASKESPIDACFDYSSIGGS